MSESVGVYRIQNRNVEVLYVRDIPAAYWAEFPSAWDVEEDDLPSSIDSLCNDGCANYRFKGRVAVLQSNLEKHRKGVPEFNEWGEVAP